MSETFKLIASPSATSTDRGRIRRAAAVASALELILAAIEKGSDLNTELEKLSAYADKIESSLKY